MKVINTLKFSLFLIVITSGCAVFLSQLEVASSKYKQNRDYDSLTTIYEHIHEGIAKTKIEELLGEPDYSPIDGLYYYSSNKSTYSEFQNKDVPVGLIVDYRNSEGIPTEKLTKYLLGPIGE